MTQKLDPTYDYICFSDLAYELDFSDSREIEKKIKRRLKYYNLGSYDQERVDYIRYLKNQLSAEISLQSKSKYYIKPEADYADLADFDIEKMTFDFLEKYAEISDSDMTQLLNFAIYLYYLR